jgi:hypothetical protein
LRDCDRDTIRSGMTEKRPERYDPKAEKPGAPDKKKRLADALRRNLTKRKEAKEAKNVDNP